ncbi:MAG: GDSL-type esterase/lipase family protein [Acidobacteriota bacterium]|nr:GDSL-type esterase/lipase family protein [Acidobacteriota bacterium]
MRLRFRLAALLIGLLTAALGAELMLRATGMGFGNSPMEPDPFLHHVHPKNYKFVQQHPSGELGGFEIEYNAEGRVYAGGGQAPSAAGAKPCRVALMGDSFTEGGQVPFAESFAGILEVAGGQQCEVRNYGVRSYSPAIYLVQWTRDVQAWKPDVVFLLLFGNDVREDARYMQRAIRDDRNFPTAIEGPSDGWLLTQLRKSYVARFVRMVTLRGVWLWDNYGQEQWQVGGIAEENPDWGGETPALVQEIDRRVRAAGSRLVVMAVPSRYRLMGDGKIPVVGDFHQTMREFTAQHGIEFLNLFEPFERASKAGIPLFFLKDIHFAADGHLLTAATIARAYSEFFPAASSISGPPVAAAFGGPQP